MRIKITLPSEKVEKAYSLAVKRNQKETRFGGMTYGGKRGSLEAHLLGILPEMAVAHYFDVNVDERIFSDCGDDGEDLVLPFYGTTQVKATTYWNDPLLRAEVEHDHAGIDSYLLTFVDKRLIKPEEVWIIGWLPRSEVIKSPKNKLLKNGPLNYIVSETELRPVVQDNKELILSLVESIRLKEVNKAQVFMKEILSRMK